MRPGNNNATAAPRRHPHPKKKEKKHRQLSSWCDSMIKNARNRTTLLMINARSACLIQDAKKGHLKDKKQQAASGSSLASLLISSLRCCHDDLTTESPAPLVFQPHKSPQRSVSMHQQISNCSPETISLSPSHPLSHSRPTHPEEKVQGLAAVEATAEGNEDGGVGRPHSRPGWAGPPQRLSHFHQAPGPDPAHYHQDSCGANAAWVGGPHRGKGEGGRWTGVREGGIVGGSRSV